MHNIKKISGKVCLILFLLFFLACSKSSDSNKIQNIDSTNLKKTKQEILTSADTIAGKKVYESNCLVCHQFNGIGVSDIYPPLANSDYMLADKNRALKNIINGFKSSVTVNGKKYKGNMMPDIEMTDKELKDVMNYILNSWGNKGGIITLKDVKAAQKP
jgi:mono/diheme cytochrome c family protein